MRHTSLATAAGIALLIGTAASLPAQTPGESAQPAAPTLGPAKVLNVETSSPGTAAQTPAPPSTPFGPSARFTFDRVDGGFLRLDKETGQVAICRQRTAGWGCQAVPEDRSALEKEIARLQEEGAKQEDELARQQGEAAKLKNDIARQQDEAVKLRNELARQEGEAVKLRNELARQEGEAAKLKNELARQQEEAAKLKNDVVRQQNQVAGLNNEVVRLKDEIANLKLEIANLREPLPPLPPAELAPPAARNDDAIVKMPTREDVERARAALEDAWRRLVDMIQNFQKDVMGRG